MAQVLFDTTALRQQRTWRLPTVATALCVVEQPDVSKEWACCLVIGEKHGAVKVHGLGETPCSPARSPMISYGLPRSARSRACTTGRR